MIYLVLRQDNMPDNVTLKEGSVNTSFEFGCGNRYDIEYQAWLAEGNQPEIIIVDNQPPNTPTIDGSVEAVELIVDPTLDRQQEIS